MLHIIKKRDLPSPETFFSSSTEEALDRSLRFAVIIIVRVDHTHTAAGAHFAPDLSEPAVHVN